VGEGFAGRLSLWSELLLRLGADFVARVSRESCVPRQHRRQGRALSYYACSSCIARQASGSGAGLSCYAGFLEGRWRPLPSPSPAPVIGPTRTGGRGRSTAPAALAGDRLGKRRGEGGWVRVPAGRRRGAGARGRRAQLPKRASLCQDCVESVTGNLHDTTTPAPGPSPVVLRMLFMHSSTGLAIPAEIVVLCRFSGGAMAPAPLPSPAPLIGPTRTRATGARKRRRARVDRPAPSESSAAARNYDDRIESTA
jgi:hypothetical protein